MRTGKSAQTGVFTFCQSRACATPGDEIAPAASRTAQLRYIGFRDSIRGMIAEFWNWWDAARGDVQAAIEGGETAAPVLHEVLSRVAALELACEFSAGASSRHALCVSANGDPTKRKLAYRWHDAAPPADEVFEYHPARIASAGAPAMVLKLGGEAFAFSDLRFEATLDEPRLELDLEIQHPMFRGLDEQTRAQVGFIALDNLLGEEDVERWIGALRFSDKAPRATVTPEQLRARVRELAATAPSGEWALLRGQDVVAVAARPLRPVDHPYLDLLCELKAKPVDHDLSTLQDNEQELDGTFGDRVFHAASVTRGDTRTAFVYIDGDMSTSRELENWAVEHEYETTFSLDPAWDAVRSFR
jgi:hypothetical protein